MCGAAAENKGSFRITVSIFHLHRGQQCTAHATQKVFQRREHDNVLQSNKCTRVALC